MITFRVAGVDEQLWLELFGKHAKLAHGRSLISRSMDRTSAFGLATSTEGAIRIVGQSSTVSLGAQTATHVVVTASLRILRCLVSQIN